MIETIVSTIEKLKALSMPTSVDDCIAIIKALLFDVLGSLGTIYLICLAVCAAIFAFNGYKLFKLCLYAGSGVVAAYAARAVCIKYLPLVAAHIPENIKADAIAMAVAAAAALLLCRYAQKLMITLIGCAIGYVAGIKLVAPIVAAHFNTLTFLTDDIAVSIMGIIVASVLGLLFRLLFRHGWIIGSGIGGMTGCGLLLGLAVLNNPSKQLLLMFMAVGAIFGIVAVVHQYNEEEKLNDIFYTYKI